MEKKKKREKGSSNGSTGVEVEGALAQNSVPSNIFKAIRPAVPVDLLKRQREAEQQVAGGPAKKLLIAGSIPPVLPFSPPQPYPLVGQWHYPPAQQPPPFVPPSQALPTPSQGQALQPGVPQQPQAQVQQQAPQQQQQKQQQQQQQQQQGGSQAVGQQGQVQTQTGQPAIPFWGTSEFPPQPPGGQFYPFPGSSGDPNWQAPPYPGAPTIANNSPYGYPGPYGYPATVGQPGYAGTWPDQAWWGANPVQPPPVYPGGYGAPYQGFGGPYGYVAPGTTAGAPPMPIQRGYIKAPPGLSQKHQRLWEVQSMENIQVWSAVARVEAELAAQRSKIMQLEGELHALKGNQEISLDAVTVVPGSQQPPKRGRHRKPVGVVINDTGVTKSRARKSAADKAAHESRDKSEDKSEEKESELEKNVVNAAKMARNEETKGTPGVDDNKNKFGSPTGGRDAFEADICANDASHALSGDNKTLVYGVPYRSSFHSEAGLQNGHRDGHALEKNGDVVGTPPNYPSYGAKLAGHPEGGHDPLRGHAGMADGSGGEDWSGTDDRNGTFEARLLYDSVPVARPIRKVLPEWEFGGEDVSEDHEVDDVVPSGQEDDEVEDDDDSGLHAIRSSKVHNLVVGLTTSKGNSPLNRW